ncbi:MAG TPA: hypothetical protein VIQ74_01455 [Gemmatimonadaceae bacterium]
MKSGKLIAALVIAALVGFLLYSTLGAQRVQCRSCAQFNGQRNCATATAATREEAARSAQTTACGTIAQGMAESINCTNSAPASLSCETK